MNQNLFLMEIKRNAAGLITWTVVITVLVAGTMFVYPIFVENQSQVVGMMTLIPKAALQFKGFSDISAIFSVLGFYAANNVVYMMLLGSIFSIVIASNILLKEEIHRTAEYLLTWPLTRTEIFVSKVSLVFLNVTLLNIVTSVGGYIAIALVAPEFSTRAFMVMSVYTFLLNMLFASGGLLLSTMVRRARSVTISGIGMVLIFYILNTIARITESVSKIGYLSPFHYVNMNVMEPGYQLEPLRLTFFILITLGLTFGAYWRYRGKDVY